MLNIQLYHCKVKFTSIWITTETAPQFVSGRIVSGLAKGPFRVISILSARRHTMTLRATGKAAWGAALFSAAVLCSCSGGSNAPQMGTPAFFWSAAKETWSAGDYMKTIDNLDKLTSDNEYAGRAQPWLLVLSSGMAQGYIDLAESYDNGAIAHKAEPLTFRRQASNFRSAASRMALHFAETFQEFQKRKDDSVPLAFPYPSGSPNPVPTLVKVANGIVPSSEELDSAQKHAVERQVLLATCRAAGAPDQPGKTQELLKTGEAKVPRADFVTVMAGSLYDYSQLYTARKLDDPDKVKIFCTRAQEALKLVPETKQTKELNTKIDAALKKAKVS
jgi:hypothetical protein